MPANNWADTASKLTRCRAAWSRPVAAAMLTVATRGRRIDRLAESRRASGRRLYPGPESCSRRNGQGLATGRPAGTSLAARWPAGVPHFGSSSPGSRCYGKTRDERKRIISDRAPDPAAPVLTRPQIISVAPSSRRLRSQLLIQLVGISPRVTRRLRSVSLRRRRTLDLSPAGSILTLSQAVSRSRDLGLLDRRGPSLSPFHPIGAMPLRARRWIVMA